MNLLFLHYAIDSTRTRDSSGPLRFEFQVGVTQGRNADTEASDVRSRRIETENVPRAFTNREHVAL